MLLVGLRRAARFPRRQPATVLLLALVPLLAPDELGSGVAAQVTAPAEQRSTGQHSPSKTSPTDDTSPAGESGGDPIRIDAVTGERYRMTRPAPPRRGLLPVPPWLVYVLGGTLLLGAIGLLGRRARKRR